MMDIQLSFPEDVERALTKMCELFSIDINEYIIEAVRDDLLCSDEGNDSALNGLINKQRREVIALLEGEN